MHKRRYVTRLATKKFMHVKKGDTVKIIIGKDKNKIGKILETFSRSSLVVVEGVNIKTKHQKSTQEGETGKISQFEAPVHSSNVMLHSEQSNISSRIFYKTESKRHKIRCLVKNKESIN